jgi:hypothetical protein
MMLGHAIARGEEKSTLSFVLELGSRSFPITPRQLLLCFARELNRIWILLRISRAARARPHKYITVANPFRFRCEREVRCCSSSENLKLDTLSASHANWNEASLGFTIGSDLTEACSSMCNKSLDLVSTHLSQAQLIISPFN